MSLFKPHRTQYVWRIVVDAWDDEFQRGWDVVAADLFDAVIAYRMAGLARSCHAIISITRGAQITAIADRDLS